MSAIRVAVNGYGVIGRRVADAIVLQDDMDGNFHATVDLDTERTYRFRYPLDGARWENDFAADDYVYNEYGGEGSAVTT
jgi:glyceraldehyde-3-phosphate dehydrogenase/erythrose-4-phosphate dehydrogenase